MAKLEEERSRAHYGWVMRAKRCPACRGTGVGKLESRLSLTPLRCLTCLGRRQVLYAEWRRVRP